MMDQQQHPAAGPPHAMQHPAVGPPHASPALGASVGGGAPHHPLLPDSAQHRSPFDSSYFIDPTKAAQLLQRLGLKGRIKPFGSYTSGLITKNSDLDVMYERAEEETTMAPVQILQKFHEGLQKLGRLGRG